MDLPIGTRVVGEAGLRGQVSDHVAATDGAPAVLVTLDDGTQVCIPTALLVAQADGSTYVPLRREDVLQAKENAGDEECVLPVIAEELRVSKRTVEQRRVRVRKLVHQRDEVIDQPLIQEYVEITRVAINQPIAEPPQVRNEGHTLIIPIVEEVLVVEKRLFLKEEVHITRHQTTVRKPQTVTLRSEELVVERLQPIGEHEDQSDTA